MNDLFRYSKGNWTWMSGVDSTNNYGIWGTKGVPSTNNWPVGRYSAAYWSSNGSLWIFGGLVGGGFYQNDLWRYTISTKSWTWVNGSNTRGAPAVYGTKGVPAPDNTPSARYYTTFFTDASKNLWLFGGDQMSDLWRFDGSFWTWISGNSSQPGFYGTKGVASALNTIPIRVSASGWADNSGRIWIFGGNIFHVVDQMGKEIPHPILIPTSK